MRGVVLSVSVEGHITVDEVGAPAPRPVQDDLVALAPMRCETAARASRPPLQSSLKVICIASVVALMRLSYLFTIAHACEGYSFRSIVHSRVVDHTDSTAYVALAERWKTRFDGSPSSGGVAGDPAT